MNELFKDWGMEVINVEYKGCVTKFTFVCKNCGEKQTTNLKDRRRVSEEKRCLCGKCTSHNNIDWKNSFEKVVQKSKENNLVVLSNPDEYKNNTSKLRFLCSCGREFTSTFKQIQKGKCKCNECVRLDKTGVNNYLYKGNNPQERICKGSWRKSVFEKDNYTCQKCGCRGGNINAHHINGWAWDIKNRNNPDNGIVLCEHCHKKYHKKYGYNNANAIDMLDFLDLYANTEVINRIKKLLTP